LQNGFASRFLSAKRFAKPFYRKFEKCKCKTTLQVVFYRQNGLQNRFTENLKSANVKRLCKSFFIGKTVCKTVLQKI
jgi:hypothetical protein